MAAAIFRPPAADGSMAFTKSLGSTQTARNSMTRSCR
jgi:hypothetical protein